MTQTTDDTEQIADAPPEQTERRGRQTERRGQSTEQTATEERRGQIDRRSGWDRRRGPGRRRNDDRKAAEEGEMTDEQFELLQAIESYKKANSVSFPTFTEVLEIIKALGYRKVAEPQPLANPADDRDD